MLSLLTRWRDLSIARKLHLVVGVMAILIAGELLALRFAMGTLSASRAFVEGEGLWSKAQKNAIIALQRYSVTKDEKDFQNFETELKIPEGDHIARTELLKPSPRLDKVRDGFIQGGIHPDDIKSMVNLLLRFSSISYLSKAIGFWTEADQMLGVLREKASIYRLAVLADRRDDASKIMSEILTLNADLTRVESGFSSALGEGSRWMERVLLSLLLLAVLSVESVGLTLAFFTTRSISRGLNELNRAADRIGRGDFSEMVPIRSKDEIGHLSAELDQMRLLLRSFYSKLETRVAERTLELENLATENARLYQETSKALAYREEFLSIVSHELKTPVTAMLLQLQLFNRLIQKKDDTEVTPQMKKLIAQAVDRSRQFSGLIETLLDLTRFRLGKFEITSQKCDLAVVVKDSVSLLIPDLSGKKAVEVHVPPTLPAHVDPVRIGQVVTNLVSNALKYGEGKPVQVILTAQANDAVLSVRDYGIGIEESKRAKVFERFERIGENPNVTGLGLGLYIARHIVEAHSGSISVTSTRGEGSTFTVLLPLLTDTAST